MAEFRPAYERTNDHEGGVANHPSDKGGFTYRGISSVHHPEWEGWQHLDRGTLRWRIPQDRVDNLHETFFLSTYWARLRLHEVRHQALAEELYDAAVLCGRGRVVRWLQRALNGLNRRGKTWQDLRVDGLLGPATLGAVDAATKAQATVQRLGWLLEAQRGHHHLERALEDQTQEDFLHGWVERLRDPDFERAKL